MPVELVELHRRIKGLRSDVDTVPTLCGQVVDAQRATRNMENVGCGACLRIADFIVDQMAKECAELAEQLVTDGLAKPPAGRTS